jgi:UDP-N-acetylglucosamine 1-carboxyvinyltransferase
MSDLLVHGGTPLSGTIRPSGNKNAVLPIFCATLLTDEPVRLANVPAITDLEKLVAFCTRHGSRIEWDRAAGTMALDHSGFRSLPANGELPQDMRSTVLLYPALLHRLKRIVVESNTKGCSLGIRELDPHFDVLRAFGAASPSATRRLHPRRPFRGARHWATTCPSPPRRTSPWPPPSPRAPPCSSTPQRAPRAGCLRRARRHGRAHPRIGTSRLEIEGVERLHGAEIAISTDYHEVVTFLALGAITGGEVRVTDTQPEHLDLIVRSFAKIGVTIRFEGNTAIVPAGQRLRIEEPHTTNLLAKIEAAPWPYFPVDLLPVLIALAVRAEGAMQFWNKIYEGGSPGCPSSRSSAPTSSPFCDPHRIIVLGARPLRPRRGRGAVNHPRRRRPLSVARRSAARAS